MAAETPQIGWEEPRPPTRFYLQTVRDAGPAHRTTEEELKLCGYVKASKQPAEQHWLAGELLQAAAWRKIDKWLLANKAWSGAAVLPVGAQWSARAQKYVGGWEDLHATYNATKLQALEALAEWCEGQASK